MKIDPLIILAEDREVISYRKSLNAVTGSVTATILLQQMLYWSSKVGYEPFYKFKEPCTHEDYKPGDSWVEELGFTKSEFDVALKKIGTKVTKGMSKAELYDSKERTALIIYWTDSNRKTWYHLNADLLRYIIISTYLGRSKSRFTQVDQNPALPFQQRLPETTTRNFENFEKEPISRFSNDEFARVNLTEDGEEVVPKYNPYDPLFIRIMANLKGRRRGLQSRNRKAWEGLLRKCQINPSFEEWMIWQSEYDSNQESFAKFVAECNNMDKFELWLAGSLSPVDKLAALGVKKGKVEQSTVKPSVGLNRRADGLLCSFCEATGFSKPDDYTETLEWVGQIEKHIAEFGENKVELLYKKAYNTLRDAFINNKIQLVGPKSFTKTMRTENRRVSAGNPADDTPKYGDLDEQVKKLRGL